MATRYNYTGKLVTDGLVLNLDAAKRDSYPGSGTTWYDLSGNGNNGTLTNGPTYTGVSKDASIVFDGVDDYVNLGTGVDITSSLTAGGWVKLSTSTQTTFLGKYGYSVYPNQRSWYIGTYTDGTSLQVIISQDGINFNRYVGPLLSDNTWRYTLFTFTNNTVNLYLNGSPVAYTQTGSNTINSLKSSSAPLIISAADGGNGNFCSGSIAQTQIYNRSLSQFEIFQNFNALKGRYGIPDIVTDGLVLNLDAGNPYSYLSGSSGTTWTDVSGQGNNGTLTNGALYANGAISFDGVDDYVNCGNTIFPSGSQNFTISIWVYLKDGVVNDYIFSKGSAAAGSAGGGFWMVNGDTYVRFTATDSIPTRSTNVEHDGVSLNTWYNFTYTYDGTTITGYKNAASAVANTSISGPINYVSDPILIGTHRYLGNFPTMDVASFTFYNRALTQEEITQNFNALRGRYGI